MQAAYNILLHLHLSFSVVYDSNRKYQSLQRQKQNYSGQRHAQMQSFRM